ncbi:hypothetical protein C1H46_034096 [Malus baccata]|uniref:non-specific serine/threonine protein kinase n=1 Tax=Malus baccata TaxID=106549 RepID=A0A540L1K7_MALBA|nr:hypothetical protein C1H46_034096 [Malus baccata]
MSLIKLAFKFFTPSCFNANKPIIDKKSHTSKEISSRRLSLSDLSNSSVCTVLSDLSNSLIGSNLHIFSHNELKKITQSFSKSNYLGEGGFGQVYRGFIDDKLRPGLEAQPVAVKVLDLDGKQGHREWLAEVVFLGQLKHPNLVNLIGYCCEDEYRLLVYEYMERGNLDHQLFKRYGGTLPWLTRIKIAIGAAKGLSCLHEEEKPVIYRDFKTSNILLDLDYTAKLSDFGLAIDGPEGDETHITTRVMGTHGYTAPEYVKTEQNLVKRFKPFLKDSHKLDRMMGPRLEGQYSTVGARKAAALAHRCLSHNPKCRPTMSSVVKTLEPLMDLTNDIPIGPFVYIVPTEGKDKVGVHRVEREGRAYCDVVKNESTGEEKLVEKKAKGSHRSRKGHLFRNRIKSLRSSTVYSDTAVYRVLGTGLYSPK